tara:strand:- start:769 stop:1641 length:873 start_codon:yes stop_codon:yes gene_type:complete
MLNILITGGNGQLGSELKEIKNNYPDYNCYFTDVQDLNICDKESVKRFINKKSIQIIINCAAYTSVDMAEEEFKKADQINHIAVANLSKIAKLNKIKLIHISTDYVFDGKSKIPYREDDPTEPQTVYGHTKLMGEKIMKEINPKNSIIIRTSWVYSIYGKNFLKTILRLVKTNNQINIVSDQIGTPTYAANLAKLVMDILPKIKNNEVQLFHYSNEGNCTWYEFATEILDENDIIKINPIKAKDYQTKAVRPLYSVLDKTKIKMFYNVKIPNWKHSLEICKNRISAVKNF